MAAKAISESVTADIVADWRTGAFSYSQLADKHSVSKAKVGQLCKGIEKDFSAIVDAGIKYQCGLAGQDRRIVDAISDVVDEKTKHIQFFNNAAITNVRQAMAEACENQNDYRARAETINKGREAVLGKTPDTAIQINNGNDNKTIEVNFVGG